MSELKVGDIVEVIDNTDDQDLYAIGAGGVVIDVIGNFAVDVAFQFGVFETNRFNNSWLVVNECVKFSQTKGV